MPFTLDHWRNPRQTIATRYKDDDISYATHGAMVAMECVRRLGIGGKQAAGMHLLDYGCGTGRIARVLAGYFGRVTAFDPVSECIAEGVKECRIPIHNLIYTDRSDHLPDASYEVIIATNVLEHLDPDAQKVMLDNIGRVGTKGAYVLMWYAMRANQKALIEKFGGGEWVEEDNSFVLNNPESHINTRLFHL